MSNEDTAGLVIGPGGMWMLQQKGGEVTDAWLEEWPTGEVLARAKNWPSESRHSGEGIIRRMARGTAVRVSEAMESISGPVISAMAWFLVGMWGPSEREMRRKAELIWREDIDGRQDLA